MIRSALTANCPADLRGIADWLEGYSGISTAIIGHHSLKRAVQQRLGVTGISGVDAYHEHLLGSPEEQQELLELLVVPETWFFRDRHPYAHLREHVNRLLRGGLPSQPLRLLSAPCSTGEEPYSMAMTLMSMGLPKEAFSIDAIDISRRSIRRARQAVYGKHSFRGVSEAEQQQHFQATAQGLALQPAIRQSVQFRCANLMVALAQLARPYDVIFCRNLLIYLEEAASQRLLEAFAALMNEGGLLIVGSAETGKVPPALFEAIREPFVFGYRRRDAPIPPLPAPAVLPSPEPTPASLARVSSGRTRSTETTQPRRPRTSRSPALNTPMRSSSIAASHRPPASTATRERLAASPAAAVPSELQLLQQQLARDPYSDAAYLQLAQWMRSHNRRQEALECLQKCLYLNPNAPEALRAMIQLTQELGLIERSRQFQGRLARLEP